MMRDLLSGKNRIPFLSILAIVAIVAAAAVALLTDPARAEEKQAVSAETAEISAQADTPAAFAPESTGADAAAESAGSAGEPVLEAGAYHSADPAVNNTAAVPKTQAGNTVPAAATVPNITPASAAAAPAAQTGTPEERQSGTSESREEMPVRTDADETEIMREEPEDDSRPSGDPKPGKEPKPGNDPKPEEDPKPGNDPKPGKEPKPGNDLKPEKDPDPADDSKPADDPKPENAPDPAGGPDPGNDPAPETENKNPAELILDTTDLNPAGDDIMMPFMPVP